MLDAQFCWLRIERSAKDKAIEGFSDAISDWMPRSMMLLSMGMEEDFQIGLEILARPWGARSHSSLIDLNIE